MNGTHFRVLALTALLVLSGAIIGRVQAQSNGAAHSSAAQSGPSADGTKKAEEQFKNIKVLKGIPADQLVPTMQFVAASLGVECDFCHVHNEFEKDDKKPKQAARKMMEMMSAINKESFEGQRKVTCYSCHRGNAVPVAIPVVMTDEPNAATGGPLHLPGEPKEKEAKENAGPTPEQLLDKYVQASGGASAIDKVTSRVMKGDIDFGGKSLPIDIYAKDPGKRISFTHLPGGDSVTAFNGREGWLVSTGHPLREMHGSDLDGAAIDADLHLPTHLKRMFSELKMDASERVGDRAAYVVVGLREGKPPVRLYFDEQTALLVRLVRFGETALGWMPTQIDYADYHDTNGVKVPYRWTLARPSGRFTIQLSEVKQNVPVDDDKFAKPLVTPEQHNEPAK